MGTWGPGPFKNDAALDFVGRTLDQLMAPVKEFLDEPSIDETFDPAFAAIVLMNAVMDLTPSRPWDHAGKRSLDGAPVRDAMLACFDEDIDELEPSSDFKRDHRAALVAALDTFVAKLAG